MTDDLISRAEAMDASEKFIKDCNPDHFVGHQKFIEYMDNAEIGSFGKWQFANGFNMGLTAAEVAIKKLPSAQTVDALPVRLGKWIDIDEQSYTWKVRCSCCGNERSMMSTQGSYPNFCENCGARMDEE